MQTQNSSAFSVPPCPLRESALLDPNVALGAAICRAGQGPRALHSEMLQELSQNVSSIRESKAGW
jgi:hypothetical protein